ncbi:hypothetical protein BBRP734_01040 [Bifidobacterium breve]|nr:hypothetical protein BBRP734_01040 [Bifidobacterium breve]
MVFTALGMSDNDIRAAKVGQHIGGYVTGKGALRGHGYRLGTIGEAELVGFDKHLHAAQRGEGREKGDLATLEVEMSVAQ